MDEQVLGAMQKWPNVPAVFGWLSLNAQGDWLLHDNGGAREGQSGEKIANEQIRNFMNRNYASTEKGEWFFQNGPQRVFADLAAAPFIVRLTDDTRNLVTHSALPVLRISAWVLNEKGQLYLQTEHGAAMLAGRDMTLITPRLLVSYPAPATNPAATSVKDQELARSANNPEKSAATPLDQRHLESLEDGKILQVSLDGNPAFTAPMQRLDDRQIPQKLAFVRQPATT